MFEHAFDDLRGVVSAVRAADDVLAVALTDGAGVNGVGGLGHVELTELVATLTRLQARADALLLASVGEVDAAAPTPSTAP